MRIAQSRLYRSIVRRGHFTTRDKLRLRRWIAREARQLKAGIAAHLKEKFSGMNISAIPRGDVVKSIVDYLDGKGER